MGNTQLKHEVNIEGTKFSVAAFGALFSYLTLNEWVALATLVYIVLQIAFLIYKWSCQVKDRKTVTIGKVHKKIDELCEGDD